jgi:hypothetical protein
MFVVIIVCICAYVRIYVYGCVRVRVSIKGEEGGVIGGGGEGTEGEGG